MLYLVLSFLSHVCLLPTKKIFLRECQVIILENVHEASNLRVQYCLKGKILISGLDSSSIEDISSPPAASTSDGLSENSLSKICGYFYRYFYFDVVLVIVILLRSRFVVLTTSCCFGYCYEVT
jgi:hypothetical protein